MPTEGQKPDEPSPTPAVGLSPEDFKRLVEGMSPEQLSFLAAQVIAAAAPQGTVPAAASPQLDTSSPSAEAYLSICGGYVDADVLFCGGMPNMDFTMAQSLVDDPSSKQRPRSALCHRDVKRSGGAKLHVVLTKAIPGLAPFKSGAPIDDTAVKILREMMNRGVDTTGYVRPRMSGETIRVHVLTHYRTLDLSHVQESIKKDKPLWRGMDLENDVLACHLLLASTHPELRESLQSRCEEDDAFAVMFMRLVLLTTSTTFEAMEKAKDEYKNTKLSKFPQFDVHKFNKEILQLARILMSGRAFSNSLLLNYLENFTSPSCPSERMRQSCSILADAVEDTLKKAQGLSYHKAAKIFRDAKHDIVALVERTDELYTRYRRQEGGWPPAISIVDKKAPELNAAQFAALSETAKQSAIAQGLDLNALVQKEASKLANKKVQEIRARDKKKNSPAAGGATSGEKTKRPIAAWRSVPPKSGETSKTSGEGAHKKTYTWCTKCRLWVWTHTDATHKTRGEAAPAPATAATPPTPPRPDVNNFILASTAALDADDDDDDSQAPFEVDGDDEFSCLICPVVGSAFPSTAVLETASDNDDLTIVGDAVIADYDCDDDLSIANATTLPLNYLPDAATLPSAAPSCL